MSRKFATTKPRGPGFYVSLPASAEVAERRRAEKASFLEQHGDWSPDSTSVEWAEESDSDWLEGED